MKNPKLVILTLVLILASSIASPVLINNGRAGSRPSASSLCGTKSCPAITPVLVVSNSTIGDFTFNSSSPLLSIGQGTTGNITIIANSIGGFSGQVTISESNLTGTIPAGLYQTLYRFLFLTAGGRATSYLFIQVPYNGTIGHFNITLTGTSGSLSHSFVLQVAVTPLPAFSVTSSVAPFPLILKTGSSNSTVINVSANSLFSGTVTLNAIVAPSPGPNATLSAGSLTLHPNGTGSVKLTVSAAASLPGGVYFLNVYGKSGGMTQSAYMNVIVVAVPVPDFAIEINPSFLNVRAGTNATFNVTLTSKVGFTGLVSFNASVTPFGYASPPSATLLPGSVVLTANGTSHASLTVATSINTPSLFWTITVTGKGGGNIHTASTLLEVTAPPDEPPVAQFNYSPANPVGGEFVSFDGSGSRDPDGFINSWTWSFGDGSIGFGEFTSHQYINPGVYGVTLTVFDSGGQSATSNSTFVTVIARPQHDVAIVQLNVYPETVVGTQTVFIQAILSNTGTSNETVSVTAYANGHPVQTLKGVFLQACSFNFCFNRFYENLEWDTTGFAAGNYTISATVSLAPGEIDPTPSDNSATDGTITLLPPPSITVTPSSGVVGTKVSVQGSGFPIPQQLGFQPIGGIVYVDFDNMSIGFTFTRNGTFTFVFDIPDAQAGSHSINVFDPYSGAHASATFTVQPTPSPGLAVSVDVGSIYFPGDTAVVYVLTTSNGALVDPSSVQLRLLLFNPDGTNITLVATPVGKGLYKATYTLSRTATLGTYAILASAHETGPLDASAIRSFEVKPTWLNQNGRALIGGATLAGLVGLVAIAWKQGYLHRRKEEPTVPAF